MSSLRRNMCRNDRRVAKQKYTAMPNNTTASTIPACAGVNPLRMRARSESPSLQCNLHSIFSLGESGSGAANSIRHTGLSWDKGPSNSTNVGASLFTSQT